MKYSYIYFIIIVIIVFLISIITCEDNDDVSNINITSSNLTITSINTSSSSVSTNDNIVTLKYPEDNTKICASQISFYWNEITNNTESINYNLVISTLANMENALIDTTLQNTSYTSKTLTSGDIMYYWRVKAYTNTKTYEWSSIFKFLYGKSTNIEAPKNLVPSNNYTICNKNTTFSWDSVTDAEQYQIVFASDTSFENEILSVGGITGTSYDFAKSNLNGIHYWRVRAISSSCIGLFSDTYTIEFLNLSSPSNMQPSDNSNIDTNKPTFKWDAIDNANEYVIQIYTTQNFTDNNCVVSNECNPSSCDGYCVKDGKSLMNEYYSSTISFATGTYYWKVRAKKSDCEGPYSNIQNFTNP